jgi:hypothetical protein
MGACLGVGVRVEVGADVDVGGGLAVDAGGDAGVDATCACPPLLDPMLVREDADKVNTGAMMSAVAATYLRYLLLIDRVGWFSVCATLERDGR